MAAALVPASERLVPQSGRRGLRLSQGGDSLSLAAHQQGVASSGGARLEAALHSCLTHVRTGPSQDLGLGG